MKSIRRIAQLSLLFSLLALAPLSVRAGTTRIAVSGDQILLNDQPVKIIGLRCSNALISDATTDDLIAALDLYRSYGVNTVSVFLMGSRFGDVKGYLPSGSLNPVYRDRLARILQATDQRGMIAIVGCLYWSTSKAREDLSAWTQNDADQAVGNTARWLAEMDFTHVILDPDNEGMAVKAEGWRAESLIRAAKVASPDLLVANNTKQNPPNEDLNMHFGKPENGKPWLDSEATPKNTPGGYWGSYSKQTHQANSEFYNYSRIGRYTAEMKKDQIENTRDALARFNGYVLASTWLQCSPAEGAGGPFTEPGGRSDLGSGDDERAAWNTDIDSIHPEAGIGWWLEFVRDTYGSGAVAKSNNPSPPCDPPTDLRIGESERVYTLARENAEIRGLAWDESSANAPRLFVLDRSGKVFAYRPGRKVKPETDDLELLQSYDLSTIASSTGLTSPRGLAVAVEQGCPVLYFLDWGNSQSRLWRYPLDDTKPSSVDLSLHMFRIGDREVFDLAYEDGRLLVSFDASGYADPGLRVQRGILRIQWDGSFSENPASVRHLPDAGTSPSRGLAPMPLNGTRYLWATAGNDHVYCAESRTGRGLFFFDRPKSQKDSPSCWGLCFGQDALWVSENVPGPDRVHRVNVNKNLDAPLEGPRVPRRLIMTIQSVPETDSEDAGAVYHYYSRPYGYEQLHNQGVWLETETITDVSAVANATIRKINQDPAGDKSSRQTMQCVEYGNAAARGYSSRYEIDLWTNVYKKFVYPHRVNEDCAALKGTNYLADDSVLYNLSDTATYDSFTQRVTAHVEQKYGVEADMQNAYWAARNVVEYIQDNYYYPSRPKRKPATVDYDRQHYDANPGNLKIALSDRKYDKTQIIACSGTSVMVAGAMRHLGIPARWLGTGTQRGPSDWDENANGLLDPQETAGCTNGHRYTQVWLGSHYGWICFDATPSTPALNDYDPPPPLQSQWRYMTRAASGHREEKRIVFNVGSKLVRPLYREFEYDPRLAIDNNCGGDQRYNLQGRSEKPELWKRPGHGIHVKNLCFINQLTVSEPGTKTRVAWQLQGVWDRIADATVSLYLQQRSGNADRWRDVAQVAKEISCTANATVVDLSGYTGKQFRIILRRDGDPETGGVSQPFDLDG